MLRLKEKEKKPELVDVILRHTTKGDDRPGILTRVQIPIEEARANLGARGFYVNYLINWPFIMSLGIGVLFTVWELALLFIGGATSVGQMWYYLLLSALMGGGMGYGLGKLTRGFVLAYAPEKSYHAWAEYDPAAKWKDEEGEEHKGLNTIVPMDYELASVLAMNTEEKKAYLQAVGLAPKQSSQRNGAESPAISTALMAGAVPVFTAKGFYNALQVSTAKRVLERPRKGENLAKVASFATIALGFVGIMALVGIVLLKPADESTPPPSANQDLSDVRTQP